MKIINKAEIINLLEEEDGISNPLGFRHSNGLLKKDMNKKINEIAGFCEQILKVLINIIKKKKLFFFVSECHYFNRIIIMSYLNS